MTATHEFMIKADGRGRLRYTAEQRASLLNAYDASGLSGPKFAALHGVKYQTFAAWRNKRTCRNASPKLPAPSPSIFIEVEAWSRAPSDFPCPFLALESDSGQVMQEESDFRRRLGVERWLDPASRW